jgi:phage shock protein A
MFAWLRKLVEGEQEHEARIEELETKSVEVDEQLGHLKRGQDEHERRLEQLDAARLRSLSDRDNAHRVDRR